MTVSLHVIFFIDPVSDWLLPFCGAQAHSDALENHRRHLDRCGVLVLASPRTHPVLSEEGQGQSRKDSDPGGQDNIEMLMRFG